MKTLNYFAIIVLALSLSCCTIKYLDENETECKTRSSLAAQVENDIDDYFLTRDDILIAAKKLNGKDIDDKKGISSIESFQGEEDASMYIVKYGNGDVEFYSADKRAFPRLAEITAKNVCNLKDNPAAYEWVLMLGGQIKALREQQIIDSTSVANIAYWNDLLDIFPQHQADTKVIQPYLYYLGESVVRDTLYFEGPLLETEWGQSNNFWNKYCPLVSSSSTNRCPAGCVAVAAGQMLYYLHHHNGINVAIPHSATCSGTYTNYIQSFSDLFDFTMIDNMPLYRPCSDMAKVDNVGIFLAFIGNRIGMSYSPNGSGAVGETMRQFLSSFYHIPNSFFGADSTVYTTATRIGTVQVFDYHIPGSIQSEMPVIIASPSHEWVIDGYRYIITRTTKYYYKTVDKLTCEQEFNLSMDDYNYTTTSRNDEKLLHMNWGWESSYDGWFSASSTTWNVSYLSYSRDKSAIIQFN